MAHLLSILLFFFLLVGIFGLALFYISYSTGHMPLASFLLATGAAAGLLGYGIAMIELYPRLQRKSVAEAIGAIFFSLLFLSPFLGRITGSIALDTIWLVSGSTSFPILIYNLHKLKEGKESLRLLMTGLYGGLTLGLTQLYLDVAPFVRSPHYPLEVLATAFLLLLPALILLPILAVIYALRAR